MVSRGELVHVDSNFGNYAPSRRFGRNQGSRLTVRPPRRNGAFCVIDLGLQLSNLASMKSTRSSCWLSNGSDVHHGISPGEPPRVEESSGGVVPGPSPLIAAGFSWPSTMAVSIARPLFPNTVTGDARSQFACWPFQDLLDSVLQA